MSTSSTESSSGVRYYVGDESPSSLIVHVTRTDGSVLDLSPYETVTVEGDQLPEGASTVLDATTGLVQRDFDTGFVESGRLMLRVRLETALTTDFSDPILLDVYDPGPDETVPPVMSTDAVEAITGVLVSEDQVVQAQNEVSLAIGADVSDELWLDSLSSQDVFWLRLAIAYQAAAVAKVAGGGAGGFSFPPGVTSVRNGDVTVTLGAGGATSQTLASLTPSAALAVGRLSWMASVRTLHAAPFLAGEQQPDLWRTIAWPSIIMASPR